MKKYTKLNQAIKMTGLSDHVLRALSGHEHLRYKTTLTDHRLYRTKDLRKIAECCKQTGAKTFNQIIKAMRSFKPSEKHDIMWLRESDKYLPKLKYQEKEIRSFCEDENMSFKNEIVIKEKGSENRLNRPVPERIMRDVINGKVNRIFCWDRKRPFRGSAVQWLEIFCDIFNVELVIVKDRTGKYTEKLKRILEEKHELERYKNQYIKSEEMKDVQRARKVRKIVMERYVPAMELIAKSGDAEAVIYLAQFRRGYDNKLFMNDFLMKTKSGTPNIG